MTKYEQQRRATDNLKHIRLFFLTQYDLLQKNLALHNHVSKVELHLTYPVKNTIHKNNLLNCKIERHEEEK